MSQDFSGTEARLKYYLAIQSGGAKDPERDEVDDEKVCSVAYGDRVWITWRTEWKETSMLGYVFGMPLVLQPEQDPFADDFAENADRWGIVHCPENPEGHAWYTLYELRAHPSVVSVTKISELPPSRKEDKFLDD